MTTEGQQYVPAVPRDKWPVHLRNYAWDIVPCTEVNGFLSALSLHPSSDEGAEVEHRASHARIQLQQPIAGLLECHAAFAARVLSAYALRLDKNQDTESRIIHAVTMQYAENVQFGVQAVLANLLAEGYLQPGPKAPDDMKAAWVGYQNRLGQ